MHGRRLLSRPSLAALFALALLAACGTDTVGVEDADIEVTPSEISFQTVIMGELTSQSVTIRSTGGANLVIDELFVDANTGDLRADFNFPGRLELASGDELVVTVVYEPTEVLRASGDLVLRTNVRNRETIRIPLVTPPLRPLLVMSPSPVDFGAVIEDTDNREIVTITNRGTAPASISNLALGGSADFTIPDLANLTYPIELDVFVPDDPARQPSRTFDVFYRPTTPGTDQGSLAASYSETSTARVDIVGQVGPSILTCEPDADFGPSPLALTTALTITCRNNGQTSIALDMLSFNADESPHFAFRNLPVELSAPTGSVTLTPASELPFVVEYTPPAERTDLQHIRIDYTVNGAREHDILLVTGVGVDNRCPIAVPRAFIQGDPRSSNSIDWATPTDILVLDGTQSRDPDGTIIDYEWSITRTPNGVPSQLQPLPAFPDDPSRRQYFIPLQGRYEFLLRVTDDIGFQDCDQPAVVTVISLPDETIHIELTWTNAQDPNETDDQGSDVDLHFVKMPSNWFSTFDTYFANDAPNWQPETPSLDIDDTDGAGPENIQMDNPVECQWYAVGVHYFAKQFGTAYVSIRVFVNGDNGNEQVAELLNRPLVNQRDFLDVGRLHWPTGQFFIVDQITANVDGGSAQPPQLTPEMVESIAGTGICN